MLEDADIGAYTLLEDIKNYLNITWSDERTDAKLRVMINSGQAYINSKYGEPANYEFDGLPRTLLFEYVRYMRDEALDVFENNYTSMILAMQTQKAVRDYAAKEDAEQACS